MCMIDYADPCQVYNAAFKKARKSHTCNECSREIEKGEIYERVGLLFEGSWSSYKTCRHCIAARKWLHENCGGFLHEGVSEELQEHFHEGYRSFWLGRAIIGMRRRWRRRSGQLMPIPGKPPKLEDMHA